MVNRTVEWIDDIADWMYRNGAALQKYFLFCLVETACNCKMYEDYSGLKNESYA